MRTSTLFKRGGVLTLLLALLCLNPAYTQVRPTVTILTPDTIKIGVGQEFFIPVKYRATGGDSYEESGVSFVGTRSYPFGTSDQISTDFYSDRDYNYPGPEDVGVHELQITLVDTRISGDYFSVGGIYVEVVADAVNQPLYRDKDGDGYGAGRYPSIIIASDWPGYADNNRDCDDNDKWINPGVKDEPYDGVDNDCDGTIDNGNYARPTITILAPDTIIIGVDQNFSIQLNYTQSGSDLDYQPSGVNLKGYSTDPFGTGFQDTNWFASEGESQYPKTEDIGDYILELGLLEFDYFSDWFDVDGPVLVVDPNAVNKNWYYDADGDGYGAGSVRQITASGWSNLVDNNLDCDDSNPDINPGMAEVPGDGTDNNCNGEVDETNSTPIIYFDTPDGGDLGDFISGDLIYFGVSASDSDINDVVTVSFDSVVLAFNDVAYPNFAGATSSPAYTNSGQQYTYLDIQLQTSDMHAGFITFYFSATDLAGNVVKNEITTFVNIPLAFEHVPVLALQELEPFEYTLIPTNAWHEATYIELLGGAPNWLSAELVNDERGIPHYYKLSGTPPAGSVGSYNFEVWAFTIFDNAKIPIEINVSPAAEKSCYATKVISFNQGHRWDYKPIGPVRSDPAMALGAPQENDRWNFVSLGFGGELVLKLGSNLYDDGTTAPDLMVVETTWGWNWRSCYGDPKSGTPETIMLEVSMDGNQWREVPGTFCRNVQVDISEVVGEGGDKLPYVRYLRITDTSNLADFSGGANGYDVDGIITCRELFDGMDTNSRTGAVAGAYNPNFFNTAPDNDDEFSLTAYPQPAKEEVSLQLYSPASFSYSVKIISLEGRLAQQNKLEMDKNNNTLTLPLQNISEGLYLLEITDELGQKSSIRLLKQ